MNTLRTLCAAAVMCVMWSAQTHAEEMPTTADTARKLPGVMVGADVTAMATVEAVNMDTREVTLREANGELVTLIAGEQVRNLPQVKVGDRVIVQHSVGIVMALSQSTSGLRERVDRVEVGRAPLGQKPGGVVRKTVEATVTVMAVDHKARTLTLKGPLRTVTLPVAEDIDLSAIKVGDQVRAAYQESLAISVQPAPAGQ